MEDNSDHSIDSNDSNVYYKIISMKRRIIISILFITLCLNMNSQVDTTIHAIKENTEKTAQHTEKGSYEYVSISVSILAFLIASITLYFSVRTFRSQRRTEKNTLRWSAKQERSNLRRIAWNLLISYRKLLTMEKILLGLKKFPLPENFSSMKIQIEDIHLNEFYGNDIDYDGLYSIGDKIRDYNQLLENRCSQAKAQKIARDLPRYSFALPRFFYNERNAIKDLLYLIDKIYPHVFDSSEKKWLNKKEAEEVVFEMKPQGLYISDDVTSYVGTFIGTPLDSIKGVLQTRLADLYFSIPFIEYVNKIRNRNFSERLDHGLFMEIEKIMEESSYTDPSNIYISSIGDQPSDISMVLRYVNGLGDKNHPYILEGKKKFDKLPLIKDYISVVLYLIELDSKNYNIDAIEDIYLIESDCEKSVLGPE